MPHYTTCRCCVCHGFTFQLSIWLSHKRVAFHCVKPFWSSKTVLFSASSVALIMDKLEMNFTSLWIFSEPTWYVPVSKTNVYLYHFQPVATRKMATDQGNRSACRRIVKAGIRQEWWNSKSRPWRPCIARFFSLLCDILISGLADFCVGWSWRKET